MNPFLTEIPRRTTHCCCAGEPFTSGMGYYSVLDQDLEGNVLRLDFCESCWEIKKKEVTGKVSWRSSVSVTKEHDDSKIRVLEQKISHLFHSSSDGEQTVAERFILALYLQRKKKLFLRGESTNESGEIALLYEIPETEEMLSIQKVPLSGIPIQEIQESIAIKLKR